MKVTKVTIKECFTEPKCQGEARTLRDRRARELRAEGKTVKCGKVSFAGLGYGDMYWLEWE
jgi:hypothetical protein